jgi:hypothetical protein
MNLDLEYKLLRTIVSLLSRFDLKKLTGSITFSSSTCQRGTINLIVVALGVIFAYSRWPQLAKDDPQPDHGVLQDRRENPVR